MKTSAISLLALFIATLMACTRSQSTKHRVFRPGAEGSMLVALPRGGDQLIIQPMTPSRSGYSSRLPLDAYAFTYETLDPEQKRIAKHKVEGRMTCPPQEYGMASSSAPCIGNRVLYDLADGRAATLRIVSDSVGKADERLFFSVTLRRVQSEYRSRIHWARMSPYEKSSFLKVAYADAEKSQSHRFALSTLAPAGRDGEDYQEHILYERAGDTLEPPRQFPAYATLGPGKAIIVPIAVRDALLRVQNFPDREEAEYQACWQPLAEPVDGRCYRTERGRSGMSSHRFPRGRVIFSSEEPLALNVDYPLTPTKKFQLADAVQTFPVHPLREGAMLPFDLIRLPGEEYAPLRLQIWSATNIGKRLLHVKIVQPDGRVSLDQRVQLASKPSRFDRPLGDFVALDLPETFFLNANQPGAQLQLRAESGAFFVNAVWRRATVPTKVILDTSGVITPDPAHTSWIPIAARGSVASGVVASYPVNQDPPSPHRQRVTLPSEQVGSGVMVLAAQYLQEHTSESKNSMGSYWELPRGRTFNVSIPGASSLPVIIQTDRPLTLQWRGNQQELGSIVVDPGVHEWTLDGSALGKSGSISWKALGGRVFVSGLDPLRPPSQAYRKRFFYEPDVEAFRLEKTAPKQMLYVELLLTEPIPDELEASVSILPQKPAAPPAISRDHTVLKRTYRVHGALFHPDSLVLDGRSAQIVTIPIPLYADLALGDHTVLVKLSRSTAAFVAVSSDVPFSGVRLRTPLAVRAITEHEVRE